MKAAGLFSGIGGIELALEKAGYETRMMCEVDQAARAVLSKHFEEIRIEKDVKTVEKLPSVDILAAGFPCQDLSQAGRTRGIRGANSNLVKHVFRLIEQTKRKPRWVVLENVPFMLKLDGGRAMHYLTSSLEALGYEWAYRVLDARAFGVPQRRRRVILVASRSEDPRAALLATDAGPVNRTPHPHTGRGFYWTEGRTGVGWAVSAVPTLKGGSTIGIASPPAIWFPRRRSIEVPDIRDLERLQGFESDWTKAAEEVNPRSRWKLVGNAVCVPMLTWVAKRLSRYGSFRKSGSAIDGEWPEAAWGYKGKAFEVDISAWPKAPTPPSINSFLRYQTKPLSLRATKGFLSRAESSDLKFEPQFLTDLKYHIAQVSKVRG